MIPPCCHAGACGSPTGYEKGVPVVVVVAVLPALAAKLLRSGSASGLLETVGYDREGRSRRVGGSQEDGDGADTGTS